MKRLEEQVTCEDDTGKRYEVLVYRHLEREKDDSLILGVREAFLAGDLDAALTVFDDENTFQTQGGKTLRRVTRVIGASRNDADRDPRSDH